jgi:uncharacterized coiled-coil DUF342 family protein
MSSKLKTLWVFLYSRLFDELKYVVSSELMEEFISQKHKLQNNLNFYNEEREKLNQKVKNDHEISELEKYIANNPNSSN